MEELIDKIKNVKENETVQIAPNIIVWKEGSSYDLDVTNRQFDDLANLLKGQKEKPNYLIDLSLAPRPGPDMINLVEKRLQSIKDQVKHTAVYTGQNYIMFLGIKFYFIRFDFPSYSPHTNLKSALESFT